MVSKKCPDCDQTLPVACKSCTCGHVFISKKQINSPPDKTENGEGRDQRLRPEIPKLTSKDFDYQFGTSMERDPGHETFSENQLINRIVIPQPPKQLPAPQLSQVPSSSESQHFIIGSYSWENNKPTTELPSIEGPSLGEGYIMSRRKRGRPKGSKNKPKPIVQPGEETSSHDDTQNTESGDPTKRKRGRPKGSKNKPKDPLLNLNKDDYSSDGQEDCYMQEPFIDHMPHISKEKAISYSIVLSDINQKMMKQSSMNFI